MYLAARTLVGLLLNVGVLLLVITGLGRLLGWVIGAIAPERFDASAQGIAPVTTRGVGLALAICLGGSVLAAALAAITSPRADSSDPGPGGVLWHIAGVLAGVGIAVLMLFIVMPAAANWVTTLADDETPAIPNGEAGVAVSGSMLTALFAWLQVRQRARALLAKIKAGDDPGVKDKVKGKWVEWVGKLAPYLTGLVLLLIAMFVLTDSFRDGWVTGSGGRTKILWLVGATQLQAELVTLGVLLLLYAFADQTSWSAHPFYKRRLATAFALGTDPDCPHESHVCELAYDRPTTFRRPPKGRPKLILCAAANVSGSHLAPPSRQAVSLTFEAHRVGGPRIGYVSRKKFESALGPNVGDGTLLAAMAISGAAFASAMGRHSKGSLNALLAVLNLRLGVWLPAPSYVRDVVKGIEKRASKRRFTYLFREIVGTYSPDDRFLYVTDGGHYENLGLVELLRRRMKLVLCFDATGGPRTLREACELAREELGVEIDWDMPIDDVKMGSGSGDSVEPFAKRLAVREVLTGTVHYPNLGNRMPGFDGMIVYGRAILTAETPETIAEYAKERIKFPNDPTGDQWFDVEQFNNYLWLGRHVGEVALKKLSGTDESRSTATAVWNAIRAFLSESY